MTDDFERTEGPLTPEGIVFDTRVQELSYAMTRRIAYYVDKSHSYGEELSLIMDVLDVAHLTLDDLTIEELAELDALEKKLIRENLRDDTITTTTNEEIE